MLWEALLNEEDMPNDFRDDELIRQRHLQRRGPLHLPFYGMLQHGWEDIHLHYCQQTNQTASRYWLPIAITTIWHHLHSVWKTITEQMHVNTPSAPESRRSLEHQARSLHGYREKVAPHKRDGLFHPDINSWLSIASDQDISNWLKGYGKAIRAAAAQNAQRPANTNPLTAYWSRL